MEQLAKIIVLKSVDRSQICTRQPTSVCRNSAYVVDLNSLDHPNDIRADDNGIWIRNGFPVAYISVHKESDGSHKIHKRSKLDKTSHHFKLIRVYYRHADSPDFKKIISTVEGNEQLYSRVCLVFHTACNESTILGYLYHYCVRIYKRSQYLPSL